MADTIRHRGPDGEGYIPLGGSAAKGWFGHRRLAILDLTAAAEQPMSSDDGQVVLSYNGEIYNFRELRRELESRGVTLRSSGDTEVVLRAYEAWGEGFVDRIDGMFALAVWDGRTDRLILARDRTGKKPLYWTLDGGRLTFGSEIKALLAAPWVAAQPATERIGEFLTYGYVAAPNTFYAGIRQLEPGSILVFGREGVIREEPYWDAVPKADGHFDSERVAALVRAAVERRMASDVPLGALLSGGIDSSIVVGLMSQASEDPIHTYSIGFPDDASFDERPHARQVADHFGTRHTEFAVKADAVALLDQLLWHHDQPYMDYSAVPTWLVSELAREHVKVVLTGDGGDEVFGGYDRFKAVRIAGFVPAGAARVGNAAARLLPVDHGYYSRRRRLERFLEQSGQPPEVRYQSWISVFNQELLADVLAQPMGDVLEPMQRHYRKAAGAPTLDRILYANFKSYLPEDLAVKMDRMSMAHSLEARSPFLDTAVIEALAHVPAARKVGLRHVKPLLRKAFWPLLPHEIFNRRKHGFGAPVGRWFRNELREMCEDEVLAADARIYGYLRRDAVHGMWDEHREGAVEHGFRFWTLLTLERWLRSDGRPAPSASSPADAVVSA
jgi:asparagine synthase (glutamine-hydrolysing)